MAMASWVLSITEDFPQHWEYAQQHGMWDLKVYKPIKAGDTIYYWQGGGSWLGRAVATADAYPIEATQVPPGPWDDWPGPPYRGRFPLRVIDSAPLVSPPWAEVTRAIGKKFSPSWYMRFDDPASEQVLASYFDPSALTPEQALDDKKRSKVLSELDEDLRVRTLQLIHLRQGQPAFRNALLRAYGATCAVTGTTTARVLEAAHISRYKGPHTNLTRNGLLLRGDIHTLFDLNLLTISPGDLMVRVSRQVSDAEYRLLDGRELQSVPSKVDERPDAGLLAQHNRECDWLKP